MEDFGEPFRDLDYESRPFTPKTTYSDVYRAAGVSPTKAEARGRELMMESGGGRF
jgi:hypothetical protein